MSWTLWRMWETAKARVWPEEGQDLAEYGLIITLVAIVAIGALAVLGRDIANRLRQLAGVL